MAFTEFYCRASGSNLNGGALSTGAEPSTTAAYTSTNGNWSTVTNQFTPTDGSTPASTVTVGDFASIYLDGASIAVFIARVTVVAGGVNGAITVSTTSKMGSAPATGATGRTIKVGGAWLGLNAATSFPFTLTGVVSATNASGNQVRVSLKNDQTYTLTSSLDISNSASMVTQGYTSTAGDGGKALITTNVTTSYGSNWSGTGQTLVDLIFANTGASNANDIIRSNAAGATFARCVFRGGRGHGLNIATGIATLVECEFYDNNKSNTAAKAGFAITTGTALASFCYFHDNTGSNTAGILHAGTNLYLINSIIDTNGGHGVEVTSGTQGWTLTSINCDYYNNVGDAIKLNTGAAIGSWPTIRNNNFIKNGGKAINNAVTGTGLGGMADNNGYGSGSQANGASDTLGSIISNSAVTYASGVTPWVDPANEDFNINLAAANFAGRGAFTQIDGTSSVTVGHPDIGAAQSLTGAGGEFSKEVSYGFS